jgi:phage baseplate assembly protein W
LPDNPHFDFPMRLAGKSIATVEQDSYTDVVNCIHAIVRTPSGYRDEAPEFGVPDVTFAMVPAGIDNHLPVIEEAIASQEPRASVVITESMSLSDVMSVVLNIDVSQEGA